MVTLIIKFDFFRHHENPNDKNFLNFLGARGNPKLTRFKLSIFDLYSVLSTEHIFDSKLCHVKRLSQSYSTIRTTGWFNVLTDDHRHLG